MNESHPLPAAPLIAQVQTPTGATWYVPHAQRHGPFLVQRRYQGTGDLYYSGGGESEAPLYASQTHLAPVLVPYLNPEAVRVAGLSIPLIMAWSDQHPEQIFTHPTYAPLCLRWGENAHTYLVTALLPEAEPEGLDANCLIAFTPYTCWLSGQTYHRLDVEQVPEATFLALIKQANMLPHEQELGLEGTWSGWYVLDDDRAKRVLTTAGYQPVLSCPHLFYGAWIYPETADEEIQWLLLTATAEEARAYFHRLPELSDQSQPSITAEWGYTLDLPSRKPAWFPGGEKKVSIAYAEGLRHNRVFPYANPVTGAPPSSRGISPNVLSPTEVPLCRRIPTLRERIRVGPYPRWQLAKQLGWELDKVRQAECRPWDLTLAEVSRLAQLLEVDEVELLTDLQHELKAWKARHKSNLASG